MENIELARTPQPPYYAVIFASVRTASDDEGYGKAAERIAAILHDRLSSNKR